MEVLNEYIEFDKHLTVLAEKVNPIKHVRPPNLAKEREAFLGGKPNPAFSYREPSFDVDVLEREIAGIEIPDSEPNIRELLEGVRRKLILELGIIGNLGDEDKVRASSLELFGVPGDELVTMAENILKRDLRLRKIKLSNADEIVEAMRRKLDELNLPTDWRVEKTDDVLVVTTLPEGVIKVPTNIRGGIPGLIVHEIGVHALRAENGRTQPLRVLSSGLNGYWATEDGLASAAQIATNTMSATNMKSYAARVIAVDSVHKNMKFREAFDRLMAFGCFNETQAFNHCLRAYRGGGYTKDLIYLQGIKMIQEYLEGGGDLELLFNGKIAIAQLEVVKRLIEAGVLQKPQFLPWFIEELRGGSEKIKQLLV